MLLKELPSKKRLKCSVYFLKCLQFYAGRIGLKLIWKTTASDAGKITVREAE